MSMWSKKNDLKQEQGKIVLLLGNEKESQFKKSSKLFMCVFVERIYVCWQRMHLPCHEHNMHEQQL